MVLGFVFLVKCRLEWKAYIGNFMVNFCFELADEVFKVLARNCIATKLKGLLQKQGSLDCISSVAVL